MINDIILLAYILSLQRAQAKKVKMADVKAGRFADLEFQIESDFREENHAGNGSSNILDFKSNTVFYYSDVQKCFYVQQYIPKSESSETETEENIQVIFFFFNF